MKTSVSSYSFAYWLDQGVETQFSLIEKVKAYGFDAIEFTDLMPPDGVSEAAYAEMLREEAARVGLAISGYSVGADLICACVAVHHLYGSPALIIDMGTATKMTVLNAKGAFAGVSIMPGVLMGLNSLSEQTAQLPKVDLEAPKTVIGKNTSDSMRSGVIFGNASMIDGMIDRIREETATDLPVYATGGFASLIVPHCRHTATLDEHLVLKGLHIIYHKNN